MAFWYSTHRVVETAQRVLGLAKEVVEKIVARVLLEELFEGFFRFLPLPQEMVPHGLRGLRR